MKVLILLSLIFLGLSHASTDATESIEVIGGDPIPASVASWVVKIEGPMGSCTGSIIADKWVLTAGHCFKFGVDIEGMKVLGGGSGTYAELVNLGKVKRVVRHPKYSANEGSSPYDLALIELKANIAFNNSVKAIRPFNSRSMRFGSLYAANVSMPHVSIAGWGIMNGRQESTEELRMITLPVFRTYEMRPEYSPYYFTKNKLFVPGFLATVKNNVGTCRGDSGGGWAMKVEGTYRLVGVHSNGDCTEVSVAVDISEHIPWLKEVMEGRD